MPLRIALDLLWPWSVGPASVPQLGSAAIGGALLATALARPRAALRHPLRRELLALGAALAVGALRADSVLDALRYGLHLGTPALWLLAWHAAPGPAPAPPRSWFVAAALPVGLSLGALALGQPAQHVLHGWPRLHGAYGNLHAHASAMAVFAAAGLSWGWLARDRLASGVGVLAGACLGATWVRGGWLWLGLALALVLAVRRRWAAVAGLAVAAALGLWLARDRWSDLYAVLSAEPPPGGWGALGSWRGRIWTDSLARWLAGPAPDVWLGRGLGGQYGLHRHLDPHSDWLSVLYQLGPLGLAAWLLLHLRLLDLLRRRAVADPAAAVAFGVLGGAIAVAALSNDWATRATPVLWTFAWVGLGLGQSPAASASSASSPSANTRPFQADPSELPSSTRAAT